MAILRPPKHRAFHPVRKMSLAWQKYLSLSEESLERKHKRKRGLTDLLKKTISSRHEALGIWTDLQLSRLYHEVQDEEGSQNTWRELSKQDGSAQPWAPRSIILILKHTPASALFLWHFLCSSLSSSLLFAFFLIILVVCPQSYFSIPVFCAGAEKGMERTTLSFRKRLL